MGGRWEANPAGRFGETDVVVAVHAADAAWHWLLRYPAADAAHHPTLRLPRLHLPLEHLPITLLSFGAVLMSVWAFERGRRVLGLWNKWTCF